VSDPGILDDAITTAAAGTGMGGGFFVLRWLVQWLTGRLDKRQAQLDAEHGALDKSWEGYRLRLEERATRLEQRMETMERQGRAVWLAFEHVAGGLIRVDPGNEALVIADRILASAFPTDFSFGIARAGGALDEDDRRRAEHGT
jgi:hypothetical protein